MEEIDRANASPLPTLGTGPSQLADTASAPNDWGCSGDGNDLILHFPAGLFPEQLANGALVGARGEDLHGPPPCGIDALNSSPVDHRVNACAASPKLRAASPPLSDVLRARPRRAHRQRPGVIAASRRRSPGRVSAPWLGQRPCMRSRGVPSMPSSPPWRPTIPTSPRRNPSTSRSAPRATAPKSSPTTGWRSGSNWKPSPASASPRSKRSSRSG